MGRGCGKLKNGVVVVEALRRRFDIVVKLRESESRVACRWQTRRMKYETSVENGATAGSRRAGAPGKRHRVSSLRVPFSRVSASRKPTAD